MDETTKSRMNLAAISKVDPYAKTIVDTSSHVAFYTFNAEINEWEKTDIEGAFFIYSRKAQPFHSVFIINRLNTTSFVEPITNQLELQMQPPFLLYRNNRSRIRGFWFYNSFECERIAALVNKLVQATGTRLTPTNLSGGGGGTPDPIKEISLQRQQLPQQQQTASTTTATGSGTTQPGGVDIFKMLAKAQEDFKHGNNAANSNTTVPNSNEHSGDDEQTENVQKFFAAAAPKSAGIEMPSLFQVLPNTLSVEQIEKAHLDKTNEALQKIKLVPLADLPQINKVAAAEAMQKSSAFKMPTSSKELENMQLKSLLNLDARPSEAALLLQQQQHQQQQQQQHYQNNNGNQLSPPLIRQTAARGKPTSFVFEKPTTTAAAAVATAGGGGGSDAATRRDPLTQTQLVQAFTNLIQNDEDFAKSFHEFYIKLYDSVLNLH